MFKLTYITHSSILIETEDARVITDPWFYGSAYLNHWQVFPKPVDTDYAGNVTHIVISHGHEDHCHLPTLNQINKDAEVFLPFTWLKGTREVIEQLGFKKVREVDSYRTIKIGKHLKLTFIVNGLDSVLVIEHQGKVYVNLNDAFNATHRQFVQLLAKKMLSRWPVIHYLMSGVGGAGYFPNTIHTIHKNDEETGIMREQFLMRLFCEFVVAFKPEKAIPFLPGFMLAQPDKLWINRIRQPRVLIDKYYAQLKDAPAVEFMHLYPGDYLETDQWRRISPYYKDVPHDDWGLFAEQQYQNEIHSPQPLIASHVSLHELCRALNQLFPVSTKGISKTLLQKLNFIIALSDISGGYIHCFYRNGKLQTVITPSVTENANLLIRTNAQNLKYAISEQWGGDVFFIGYGADLDILKPSSIEDNLDIISLRVLSVFPTAKQYLKKHPLRAARYFLYNRIHVLLALKQKFIDRKKANKLPFNERSRWITLSNCETCRACDIPLMDADLARSII